MYVNKKQQKSARMRAALVAAADPLFAARGYDGVGAEEIVAVAGATRGALYHHFEGKRELFAAVTERRMAELEARMADAAAGAASPIMALKCGIAEFLDAATDAGLRRIVFADGPAVLGWTGWRAMDARHGLGLIERTLIAAKAAGLVHLPSARVTAHLLVSATIEGALLVAEAGDDRHKVRGQVEAALFHMIEAMRVQAMPGFG